ncbi:MAG: endonuclease/exonuclease/phosphatase family protein [Cyanobacteria bacterium P01_A01_bin.45]
MSTKLRIATFNLENLDQEATKKPSLEERIALMRPQLLRLNADILCLQEVHGQEEKDKPRDLLALKKLLEDTPYSNYNLVSTKLNDSKDVFDKRNLVTLSRFEITEHNQYKHEFASPPLYRQVTAEPQPTEADKLTWERPILLAKIQLPNKRILNIINLHLKSKLPTPIHGQKIDRFTWKTSAAWAEGFFLSSMRRVGQALETRILVDKIFDEDETALVAVVGDFNAEGDEVPTEAICGAVEDTGNSQLSNRVLIPCDRSIPESQRYSLFHQGAGKMLDHLLISRSLMTYYRGAEVHNEVLHDESIAFATDKLYPESDHAPLIAEFDLFDS